jgi:hypothetical protein
MFWDVGIYSFAQIWEAYLFAHLEQKTKNIQGKGQKLNINITNIQSDNVGTEKYGEYKVH